MSIRQTGNGNPKPRLGLCERKKSSLSSQWPLFLELPRLLQLQGRHHAGCGLAPFETSLPGFPLFDGPNPLGAIRSSNSSTLSSCTSTSTSRSFFILLHYLLCIGLNLHWLYL